MVRFSETKLLKIASKESAYSISFYEQLKSVSGVFAGTPCVSVAVRGCRMQVEIFQRRRRLHLLWRNCSTLTIISTTLRDTNGRRRLLATPLTLYQHLQRRLQQFQSLLTKASRTYGTGSSIEILVKIGVTPVSLYQYQLSYTEKNYTVWVTYVYYLTLLKVRFHLNFMLQSGTLPAKIVICHWQPSTGSWPCLMMGKQADKTITCDQG